MLDAERARKSAFPRCERIPFVVVRYNNNSVLNKMNHVEEKVGRLVMSYSWPQCFVTVQTF